MALQQQGEMRRAESPVEALRAPDGHQAVGVGELGEAPDLVVVLEAGPNRHGQKGTGTGSETEGGESFLGYFLDTRTRPQLLARKHRASLPLPESLKWVREALPVNLESRHRRPRFPGSESCVALGFDISIVSAFRIWKKKGNPIQMKTGSGDDANVILAFSPCYPSFGNGSQLPGG